MLREIQSVSWFNSPEMLAQWENPNWGRWLPCSKPRTTRWQMNPNPATILLYTRFCWGTVSSHQPLKPQFEHGSNPFIRRLSANTQGDRGAHSAEGLPVLIPAEARSPSEGYEDHAMGGLFKLLEQQRRGTAHRSKMHWLSRRITSAMRRLRVMRGKSRDSRRNPSTYAKGFSGGVQDTGAARPQNEYLNRSGMDAELGARVFHGGIESAGVYSILI